MTDLTNNPIPIDFDDPAEVISIVPYEFNYHPSRSFVFLSLCPSAAGLELGASARVDIDRLLAPAQGQGVRAQVCDALDRQQTSEAFIVIYSEELFRHLSGQETCESQHARANRILHELAWWFDLDYFHPSGTFVVGDEAWRCLSCSAPDHCPPGGHDRRELNYTRASAEMVFLGRAPSEDREELIRLPPGPPEAALDGRVEAEIQCLRRSRRRPMVWKRGATRKWKAVLEGENGHLSPADKALLALSLHCVPLRDNVIYGVCTGRGVPDPDSGEQHFSRMFHRPTPPRAEEIHAGIALLQDLAENCPNEYRAPILSVWAWAHWWAGNRTEASILTELALERDFEYSLARTLRAVLLTRSVPPWKRAG